MKRGLTQDRVAKLVGSSQSRVAKMEAGGRDATTDLYLEWLLKLGESRKTVARVIAG